MVLYFLIIECLKLGHVSENMMSTEVNIKWKTEITACGQTLHAFFDKQHFCKQCQAKIGKKSSKC